jgi:hypothetical protein
VNGEVGACLSLFFIIVGGESWCRFKGFSCLLLWGGTGTRKAYKICVESGYDCLKFRPAQYSGSKWQLWIISGDISSYYARPCYSGLASIRCSSTSVRPWW